MTSRRKFIQAGTSLLAALPLSSLMARPQPSADGPVVVSTWPNVEANKAAWEILSKGGKALDAVEAGAKVPEANPKETSVGYGGLPDRDGKVSLDACIMDHYGNCGSVAFVQNYMHVISLARLVMEKTPHVMLVGDGAEQFAAESGFRKENLLTKESEKVWKEWVKANGYKPVKGHDTIGMLARDSSGEFGGGCTTSGMAFKMHGRVGDSPIIGAGLFVDGEVGAATATGVGEEMIRIAGSHTIVELMRSGRSAQEACEEAIKRVVRKHGDEKASKLSVAFLALGKDGSVGAYSTIDEFEYTISGGGKMHEVIRSGAYFK